MSFPEIADAGVLWASIPSVAFAVVMPLLVWRRGASMEARRAQWASANAQPVVTIVAYVLGGLLLLGTALATALAGLVYAYLWAVTAASLSGLFCLAVLARRALGPPPDVDG